ncbi:gamma-glutamyl-gamma-aminobutyrate hydrolase family protein [Bacillus sp. ISL-51]|uniref:gamma-glutamyl-gamma-aminobutyrate hydrolase family protein n=1 Tax=Bacteria TaxID=2 RepID=UPI001BE887E1|nr:MULTISPECIES: gamma-glutamyl-gamma-aminobutyrate hydrolase family protein [Bacteria]MBT2573105.1 gamma-glutamyl-gamma-aminobutyrate hydrolase family protein [Bacillus sp. ISL-51]MBT2635008.1 gamma-glutamyl-gamma-aminobutyrate hydrolase family protein [Bacillus sp. ISL-26]MBT2712076.1 gamma-glutamyl-gamma-aminobutyrate hydrolase family protein [Pseudomonas sp. ISL-88]
MPQLIGITGNIKIDQSGPFPGYDRAYVNNDYVQSVAEAGGVPFILPVIKQPEMLKQQISRLDGVILSGGQDVNPQLYGEEPLQALGGTFPDRDTYEQQLIKTAIALNKPILAICRGVQILNVTFGGSLYQDLTYASFAYIKHNQEKEPSLKTHCVSFEAGSHLHSLFGDSAMVNSFHHQIIKDVAPSFKATAYAKDGVIEGIERQGDLFVVGVQWHPEMLTKKHDDMKKLFSLFIERCN